MPFEQGAGLAQDVERAVDVRVERGGPCEGLLRLAFPARRPGRLPNEPVSVVRVSRSMPLRHGAGRDRGPRVGFFLLFCLVLGRQGLCERDFFVLPNIKRGTGSSEFKFTGVESIATLWKTLKRPDGQTAVERRYCLASVSDQKLIAESIRAHWGVENGLHWQLGVRFKEDGDKTRDKNGQQNLMLMRKMALHLARS